MKKLLFFVILIYFFFLFYSCTQNQRAKGWGGTAEMEVPCNTRVINITWKGEDLWISTTPMPENYEPQTHTFQEKSSFGVMEGKYIIKESRCK